MSHHDELQECVSASEEIQALRLENERLHAKIAELHAGVPTGHVLVPIEPTPEMIAAAHNNGQWGSIYDIYRAMMAAASST